MIQIRKCLNSFRFAYNGIKHCARSENNFRVHLLATVAVLLAGFYSKLSEIEWCMIVLAIGLVLVTEMVNSAIEKLVDLVSSEQNSKAGLVKDMAAGAVLVAAIAACIIGGIVFVS